MKSSITVIGIDGGVSKVSVHIIKHNENSFTLSEQYSIKEYKNFNDFQIDFIPVDLETQLAQIQNSKIELTKEEKNQANAYYSAFIESIAEIVECSNNKVLIGIGMPGIKSADSRGIIAMANGPRMPNFATEIEKQLASIGIALVAPIHQIGSDADYCGIGEEFAGNGAFRDVENAYYLGGGTGVADALKLHGNLVTFDECKSWLAKTWEFESRDKKSMEIYCSANGIQSIYSQLSGKSHKELVENKIYMDQILINANNGENSALETLKIVVDNLSKLIFERISTIYSGWQKTFNFIDPNKKVLDKNHLFIGTLFDRIVIGQRLGTLLKNELAQKLIMIPILKRLTNLIVANDYLDDKTKSHYLDNNKFRLDIIVTSNLREAPALGAGIDAWNNYVNRK